jgi:hypothetical protein
MSAMDIDWVKQATLLGTKFHKNYVFFFNVIVNVGQPMLNPPIEYRTHPAV